MAKWSSGPPTVEGGEGRRDKRRGDYEIGYGKPPKQHQFQPGQSGNRKGREKGSRGLRTDLGAELEVHHSIQVNGKTVEGTKQRLMIFALATRAATGDVKAAQLLLPLIVQIFGFEDRGTGPRKLSAQDQAILDEVLSKSGTDNLDQTDGKPSDG